MDYFKTNLTALARKQPELAALLRTTDRSHIKTFPSSDGAPAATIEHDGKNIFLHSRYNPLREARQTLRKEDYAGVDYFIFLGFGLGYTLDAVVEKYQHPERHYFIVEADLGILRAAFEARDLTPLLTAHDVYFAWPSSGPELAEQWQRRFNLASAHKSTYVMHSPSLELHPEHYKIATEILQGQIYRTVADYTTLSTRSQISLDNFVHNFPVAAAAPGITTFARQFTDTPAVIVSAGPSLDKNIHELRGQEDRVLILATDTTLKPLLAAGVEPHFVMTCDPSYANYLHLAGAVTRETLLIMEATAHPQSPEGFAERTLACTYTNPLMESLSELLGDKGTLNVWGSVATMALDFALFLGCDPVVFIGQDLAYTGGRLYCSNVYFEKEWFQDVHTPEEYEQKLAQLRTRSKAQAFTDIYGNSIETTRSLIAYRDWIIKLIGDHPERRFINATEGGILHGPVEILSFRETLARHCNQDLNLRSRIDTIHAEARELAAPDVTKNLAPLLKELKSLRNTVRRGINAVGRTPKGNFVAFSEHLDNIKDSIYNEKRLAPLIDNLNQPANATFLRRIHALAQQPSSPEIPAAIRITYHDYFTSVGVAADKIGTVLSQLRELC